MTQGMRTFRVALAGCAVLVGGVLGCTAAQKKGSGVSPRLVGPPTAGGQASKPPSSVGQPSTASQSVLPGTSVAPSVQPAGATGSSFTPAGSATGSSGAVAPASATTPSAPSHSPFGAAPPWPQANPLNSSPLPTPGYQPGVGAPTPMTNPASFAPQAAPPASPMPATSHMSSQSLLGLDHQLASAGDPPPRTAGSTIPMSAHQLPSSSSLSVDPLPPAPPTGPGGTILPPGDFSPIAPTPPGR